MKVHREHYEPYEIGDKCGPAVELRMVIDPRVGELWKVVTHEGVYTYGARHDAECAYERLAFGRPITCRAGKKWIYAD